MESKKGIVLKILAFALAVALLVGLVFGVAYAYKTREAVGTVASNPIRTNEFVFILKTVRSTLEQSMLAPTATKAERDSFWSSVVEGKKVKEMAENIALDEAKKIKIQLIKAKANNIELTKEEKAKNQKEVDETIQKLGGEASERIRNIYGVSISEYKKIREEMSLVKKYADFERAKLEITDQEIEEFYNKNYENQDIVTVRHILLSTIDNKQQQLPDDQVNEAKNLANELMDRVKNGEDFAQLVRDNTADIPSRDTKGQYTFRKGQFVPEFEAWAFNSKPGDIGVVKSDYGFHVMVKPTFDELKEEIKERVLDEKYAVMLDEWAKISIYNIKVNEKALQNARHIVEE
ncbi:MAG: peptidylprolyl isomerase [Clostridiales bacterium]|nr:peptidylprolyl isomerase [Clostridiales bacterium]